MAAFVEEARKIFDRIVLVSAPVGESSAAAVLSEMVDGTVVVVDKGTARRADINAAMREFRAARAHLCGVVLIE
jgi:receptor protein-tyrosine kinase